MCFTWVRVEKLESAKFTPPTCPAEIRWLMLKRENVPFVSIGLTKNGLHKLCSQLNGVLVPLSEKCLGVVRINEHTHETTWGQEINHLGQFFSLQKLPEYI